MKLTVIGSGDAFGSGGRLLTCFHVATAQTEFLIDCGATALIGFNRLGMDPNRVSTIFISHLHGDHFAGLVWWMLHALYVSKRRAPLVVVGPEGIEERYHAAAEALFPGADGRDLRHDLTWVEFKEGQAVTVNGIIAIPYLVSHPSGAPSYGLRVAADGKIIGYSGDTEWVDVLETVAAGANLYITECYGFDQPAPYHMTWQQIEKNLDNLRARQILLSHMGGQMLANADQVRHPSVALAEDGLTLEL